MAKKSFILVRLHEDQEWELDEDGQETGIAKGESFWNIHEVRWIRQTDLPQGYAPSDGSDRVYVFCAETLCRFAGTIVPELVKMDHHGHLRRLLREFMKGTGKIFLEKFIKEE